MAAPPASRFLAFGDSAVNCQWQHIAFTRKAESPAGTRIEGRLGNVEADLVVVKGDLVTVKTGVHAILDLLDANLVKKNPKGRLAGRLMRRRDDGAGHG